MAAAVDSAIEPAKMLWMSVVFVLVLVGGFVAVLMVRKKLFSTDSSQRKMNSAFTLEQIRQMRSQGRISDSEYENLRETIIQDSQTK